MATYAWTVIGAGPAGIAAVGRLLDQGIAPDKIAWIDPAFAAGDLGGKWRSVSSNTIAGTFMSFLNGSAAFRFSQAPPSPLAEVDPEETCALALVADPWCGSPSTCASGCTSSRRRPPRCLCSDDTGGSKRGHPELTPTNVVLAVGAVPKRLDYPIDEIPVEVALDPEKLADVPLEGATVAVLGSSHSSMIALPHLLRHPGRKGDQFLPQPAQIRCLSG